MALTVLDATDHIVHAIGGPLIGISNRRLLDEAGRKLYGLNDWNFLKRQSATLDLTASQSYIALPAGFGEILSIGYTSGFTGNVVQTTISELSDYRSLSGVTSGYMLYVALSNRPDAVTGVPAPVLELGWTPTTTQLGVLTLFYRAGWVDLANSDQTFIPIPPWMEAVYIQVLRATAWGYQTDDWGKLNAIIGSADWLAAIQQDRRIQWSHGPISGGALECANADECGDWYLRTPALPPAPP